MGYNPGGHTESDMTEMTEHAAHLNGGKNLRPFPSRASWRLWGCCLFFLVRGEGVYFVLFVFGKQHRISLGYNRENNNGVLICPGLHFSV